MALRRGGERVSGQRIGRLVTGLWEALGGPVGRDLQGTAGDHPGQSENQHRDRWGLGQRRKGGTMAALSPDRCRCDHDRALRRPPVFFAGAFFAGAGVSVSSAGSSVSLKPTIPPSYASASNVRALSNVRP